MTSRNRLLKNDKLAKTNQQLSLKLENFEERLSLENSKLQVAQGANSNLKDSLLTVRKEKEQLQKLLDQNFGMLSKCRIWGFWGFENFWFFMGFAKRKNWKIFGF